MVNFLIKTEIIMCKQFDQKSMKSNCTFINIKFTITKS